MGRRFRLLGDTRGLSPTTRWIRGSGYFLSAVLSATLSAVLLTASADLWTTFLVVFLVVFAVFLATLAVALPVDSPAFFTSLPASLMSSFAPCGWAERIMANEATSTARDIEMRFMGTVYHARRRAYLEVRAQCVTRAVKPKY